MKLLILIQAKVEEVGKIAINPSEIVMLHQVIDKFDYVIKGVTGLRTRQAEGFYIAEDIDAILELIEQEILN